MRRYFKIKDKRDDLPERIRSLHGATFPELLYPAENEIALDMNGKVVYVPADAVEEAPQPERE